MITDAQFDAWLVRENVQRCVLVELEAWSGGGVVTRYVSTHGFVSFPTDTPANTPYDEILLEVPRYRSVMGEQLRGFSSPAEGQIVIDNSSGERDDWLLDAWDGRPFRMYLGDPSWTRDDFRLIVDGVIEDIFASESNRLTLRTQDKQHLLQRPINTTLITGTDATEDAKSPVCYGECFNITPVLKDAATHRYKFHDGQAEAVVQVYSNGTPVGFTPDLANGEFTLAGAAGGTITADVKGSKTGGTYVNKTGAIMARILTERTTLTSGDIDASSITALDTAVPGAVGVYATRDEVIKVLDQLAIGCGAFYTFDRSGKFVVAQLAAPSGSGLKLEQDDVEQSGIAMVARWLPSKSVRVAYQRVWTNQSYGLSAGISDARRAELAQGYKIAKATNSVPQHLLADDPEVEMSLFVNESDAAAEATRRAALYSQVRFLVRASCFMAPAQATLGDIVYPDLGGRFGLDGTVPVVVVGIDESPTTARIELTMFY